MILHDLNDSQQQAITTTEGPVLVVAGPGTGKTLTIIRRIEYLINQGVNPENILAVTFTNRAAKEMKERAESLLGRQADKIFIGTFHLLGIKLLREMGLNDFVLYNRDEQINILKPLVKGSNIRAHEAAERISRIKNFDVDVDDEVKDIYEAYQNHLNKNSALDFDDLILKPVQMLNSNSEFLRQYRERFKYIMVDEYQDINPAQCRFLRLLAGNSGNICAVGDVDQAIYAFRGANVENFLNFGRNYKDAKIINLTENYRSTPTIVNASNIVIKNNRKRIDKGLNPARKDGTPITIISVPDDKAEGDIIVREIEQRIGGTSHYKLYLGGIRKGNAVPANSYKFSDFAVFFRTNAQLKTIEEAFIASGIPYQVIGRRNSIQRKEIEDTITYLKSIINPDDSSSEQIVLNEDSLLTAEDFFDPRADAVTLMTLHMAKGLEFRVVFITGVEDGLMPFTLNKDNVNIEEERRLFYVGMTRAKDDLFIIHARNRFLYGQRLIQSPSPFIGEIPDEFINSRFIPDKIKDEKKDRQIGLF